MNQQIKLSQAVKYVVIAIAAILFLAIWPTGLIQHTNVSKSDEKVARESDAVNVEHNLTQMFVAEEGELNAVNLYVCNEMQGETITFRLYDASYTELFNTFYIVKSNQELPGFVHIPVGYDLEQDQEYYYTLEGLSTDLYVNLENTYESTSIVNGILAYSGEELPGYNVIIQYEYAVSFSWWQIVLFGVLIALITAGIIALINVLFKKVWNDTEVKVQKVLQVVLNPVIAIVALISLYLVFPGRRFGTGALNYAFYDVSIIMLTAFLFYLVNYRRTNDSAFITFEQIKEKLPNWIQIIAFAEVLWYCFEYMNGLYDIHHAYATSRILFWFCIAIIATYKKKEILNIPNLIWLLAGGVFAYFYAKPYFGIEEQGELYKLRAYVILVGGFVILNMIMTMIALVRKKIKGNKPNLLFSIAFIVFVLSLFIFRNTREWPIFVLIICALLYFRMAFWTRYEQLMSNFCAGIILNFIMMVCFSLWHRPFHRYMYYRYDMTYHTVTLTAEHLTLVMCAVLVAMLIKYIKTRSIKAILPHLFLVGMACNYMLFTLSRTGYLATGLMALTLLTVISILFIEKGKRIKEFFKQTGIIIAAFIYMFPITFTLTRTIPALVNDPVIYDIEPCVVSITKGVASDSELYIDISRFFAVLGSKVFGVGEDVTSKNTLPIMEKQGNEILLAFNSDDIYAVTDEEWYVASAESDDYEEAEEEKEASDITNGRIEIYQEYLKYWNVTGHPDMGITFPDGSISVHAHDIFLQVIHDHGLPVGIYFILFMIFAVIVAVKNVRDNKLQNPYQLLIPTILIGFLAAGITEWVFHPCNPFGISIFIVMVPLFYRNVKKEQINEEKKSN